MSVASNMSLHSYTYMYSKNLPRNRVFTVVLRVGLGKAEGCVFERPQALNKANKI